MKVTKLITSILVVSTVFICITVFTSSSTIKKSDNERAYELKSDIVKLKEEIKTLKSNLNDNEIYGMDPLIGEVIQFAGNFEPRGWRYCNGQLLKIRTHGALFAILGTTYGGDGKTTFALPNLNEKDENGVMKFPRHIIAMVGVFPSRR